MRGKIMATPSQTAGTSVITHQEVTHPESVVSAAIDVSAVIRATLFLFHAFIEIGANTNPQKWLIQTSALTTGDEDWITLQTVNISFAGTVTTEALTATEPVGETALAVTDASEYASGDGIYIQDAGVAADSEWGLVDIVDTTPAEFIHLVDGLTNAKDASDFVFDNPQTNAIPLELEAHSRLRVIYINEGGTAMDTAVKATLTTLDSYTPQEPLRVTHWPLGR